MIFYHPHELWLKGKNRPEFEKALERNILHQMKSAGISSAQIVHRQAHTYLKCNPDEELQVIDISKRVFGVANFGRCFQIPRDLEQLKSSVRAFVLETHTRSPIASFKVETTRPDKRFHLTSPELSRLIGEVIFTDLHLRVDLHQPAFTLFIEVHTDSFVFYSEKIDGAMGLPVGSSGRSVCLLSGGFDSPVAAWTVMRRGCAIHYVHFHSAPYSEWKSSISKVRRIVQHLATWGGPTKFYAVPIGESQRLIARDAPEKLRVTLYRRLMLRIAREIARQTNSLALTTGDSLGQVASQTIESMTAIQAAIAPFLVMRPMLGNAKFEILERARAIGTHDLSVLPGGDCCSHMLPKKVATKPSIEEAEQGEQKLNIEEMVRRGLAEMQLIDASAPWNDGAAPDETAGCPFTFED
jgi:thiamine biosynthesis protein ThiI